jgi:site-specific DNA recombinase
MPEIKQQRCAVYTRKSSEEGLEQDFNSLEAQREAGEAYVRSQAHEGWTLIPDHYDDGGFSGGNMERPALTRLMQEVRSGSVDIIVIYKIDRLTRSLMDFAKLADDFDKHGVSFVSVTQQFNTTTSMGRLMLNVLLSFAQFERELTGERIRDKFAASKRRGMWMGGLVPLGYDVQNRSLVINENEAQTVREIFKFYLELGSVRAVHEELDHREVRTKIFATRSGRIVGGLRFTRGHLYKILGNPLYVGDVTHKGERHKGLHRPIIDQGVWERVQIALGESRQGPVRRRPNAKAPNLLAGLLVDEFGNKLTSSHAVKDGKRYRYYESRPPTARGVHTQSTSRYCISAPEIEETVVRQIVSFLTSGPPLVEELAGLEVSPGILERTQQAGRALSVELDQALPSRQIELIAGIVDCVTVGPHGVNVELGRRRLQQQLLGRANAVGPGDDSIHLSTPAQVGRLQGGPRSSLQVPAGSHRAANPALVRAVACGKSWFDDLVTGRVGSFREIGMRIGVSEQYVRRMLDLAFLAPELVETILSGENRPDLAVLHLTRDDAVPSDWSKQRSLVVAQRGSWDTRKDESLFR